jgi:hypothetical protein
MGVPRTTAGSLGLTTLLAAGLTVGVAPAAGAAPAAATSAAAHAAAGSQSPIIIYEEGTGGTGVYASHDDGTLPFLVAGPGAGGATVSLDGRTVVYAKSTASFPTPPLWVVGSTGAGRRQVSSVEAPGELSLSADGSKVVGVRGGVLVEVTVATGASVTVPGSTGESWPSYSPDGKTIAAKPASGAGTVFHTGSVRTVKANVRPGEYSPDGSMLLSVIRPAGASVGTVVASRVDGSGDVTFGTASGRWMRTGSRPAGALCMPPLRRGSISTRRTSPGLRSGCGRVAARWGYRCGWGRRASARADWSVGRVTQ